MTRLLKKLVIIYLCIATVNPLYSQDDFIKTLNDTIHSIKYVFEARIDSVQTFVGDKNGNPVSYGTADWSCGAGNFDAISYSKIWVSVCRVYKGKLPKKVIFLISNPYVSMYATAQPNGDTTLGYIQNYPSHGNYESPLMPSKSYPITNLYWCFDVSPIGSTGFYRMSKYSQIPMKVKGSIPNSHGYFDEAIIYAWVGNKSFMTQEELSLYLKNIKTLNSNPHSQCE